MVTIKRQHSSYVISPNPDGRKNKIQMKSSEFPMEVWMFHNKADAMKFIDKTERIISWRKKRGMMK